MASNSFIISIMTRVEPGSTVSTSMDTMGFLHPYSGDSSLLLLLFVFMGDGSYSAPRWAYHSTYSCRIFIICALPLSFDSLSFASLASSCTGDA